MMGCSDFRLVLGLEIESPAGFESASSWANVQQSRDEMEVLLTLLAECYERGSVMLTSRLPFSQWERIFKDPMTAAAAIDRLVHHSVILDLNLPSYRLEASKQPTETTESSES